MPTQRALPQTGDVLAVEVHRSLVGTDETHDALRQGRLAAAGLTHHTQGLAGLQAEGDVVDRADQLGVRGPGSDE